jgi:hypothetical protein
MTLWPMMVWAEADRANVDDDSYHALKRHCSGDLDEVSVWARWPQARAVRASAGDDLSFSFM